MDLVSTEEMELYLSLDSGDGGTKLSSLISSISMVMARFSGRDGWGPASSRTEYHHGGTNYIAARLFPIVSVTSINDDPDHEWSSSSVIDAADYHASTERDGMIWFSGNFTLLPGGKSVKLVYTGGYSAISAVPVDLKLAAQIQIKKEWDVLVRRGIGEPTGEPGEVLPEVRAILLNHTRKMPFA